MGRKLTEKIEQATRVGSVTANDVMSNIVPALNILRSIELGIQDHPCFYQLKVPAAINNLVKLICIAKRAEGDQC